MVQFLDFMLFLVGVIVIAVFNLFKLLVELLVKGGLFVAKCILEVLRGSISD
jgi:hypothetical protein